MTARPRKSAPPHEKLSRREREIMDAVFALSNRASAEDIRARLSHPPGYSAVRAMLARLEAKGYLRHTEEGLRYIYSATTSPATARKAALQQHLRVFFGGSLGQMMTALLNYESWTDEELDGLQSEIERVRKEKEAVMAELSLIAKVTVILALALGVTRALHRVRASVRSLILASAFGLLLLLPLASSLVAPRTMAIPSEYAPTFFFDQTEVSSSGTAVATPPSGTNRSNRPWRVPSIEASARVIWAAGAVASLVPLLIGLWRVRALRRRARAWDTGQRLASSLRGAIGVHRTVDVVLHDALVAPMTCGWRRPTIAMPADAPGWPAADIRQALLHELEHVRRHDWPIHVLARLTCSLYWFHPAAWICWRQLCLESERACDDAVVVQAESTAYAEQLVALARRLSKRTPTPLLSMAERSTLTTRVSAVLNSTIARGRAGATSAVVIIGSALLITLVVSPFQAVPAAQRATEAAGPAQDAFEVASVKPVGSASGEALALFGSGCDGSFPRVENNRFRVTTTLYALMTWAYGFNNRGGCSFVTTANLITGGPSWVRSERFEIQTVLPGGTPAYSLTQFLDGEAPRLEAMLRTLLAERFKLVVRRETRDVPIYALTVARGGAKVPAAKPGEPVNFSIRREPDPNGGISDCLFIRRVGMNRVALMVGLVLRRPVVDRTGLTGEFTFDVRYAPPEATPGSTTAPSLVTALQEQLGLRVEDSRAPVEGLVIENVERPTAN